eukprot:6490926-Prymnesium_polylepis.2
MERKGNPPTSGTPHSAVSAATRTKATHTHGYRLRLQVPAMIYRSLAKKPKPGTQKEKPKRGASRNPPAEPPDAPGSPCHCCER